jgi:hypothetical protein
VREESLFRVVSVPSAVKKNSCRGTADYADEKDAADEWKQHQQQKGGLG